jgi:predicted Zn-dependent protease
MVNQASTYALAGGVSLLGMAHRYLKSSLLLIACTVFFAQLSCPAIALSEKKEIEIGAKSHKEILEKTPIYHDEQLQAYVQRVGEKLAKQSERPHLEWLFTIIDSQAINAFTTSAGYVYINRGLMAYMTTEAQLAAVLAHEIGHAAARHAAEQKTMGTVAEAASMILAGVVAYHTGSATAAGAAHDASTIGSVALVRGYGREMELEADELGAKYLLKSGYDPQAMAEVIGVLKDHENFSRLKAKETGEKYQGYHGLFSTHPRNDQRLQNVISEVGSLPANQTIHTEEDNAEFRQHIDFLKYSDESLVSAIVGSRYYHRSLDFTVAFPTGWQIKKRSSVIQAIGPNDRAAIQLQVKKGDKDLTPKQYTERKLGVIDLTETEQLKIGELEAYTGVLPARNNQPDKRMAVIYHRGRAFVFIAKANNAALASFYDSLFVSSITSFRPLNDDDKTLALSRKIRYLQLDTLLSFEQLASYSPLKKYPEEQLRLLNGHYPNGEPKEGEWIKIVE